jgi:hypothetical protein
MVATTLSMISVRESSIALIVPYGTTNAPFLIHSVFRSSVGSSRRARRHDIDEFERGWPKMKLEDLRYLVSAIIAIAENR